MLTLRPSSALPNTPKHLSQVLEVARQSSDMQSALAWSIALKLWQSPITPSDTREELSKTFEQTPRQPGFYIALAHLPSPGFERQIDEAIKDDNPQLTAAANRARDSIQKAIEGKKATEGKRMAELTADQGLEVLLGASGNLEEGKELFTRQGCTACHAVSMKEVQKGPYLGDAGGKFTREYLIQAVLDPGAIIAQGFQTTQFEMNDGHSLLGFVTNMKDKVIEVRDIAGIVTKLNEDDIKSQSIQKISMMPPGLMASLSVAEAASLVDYLESLKN